MSKVNRLGAGLMLFGNSVLTLATNSNEIYSSAIIVFIGIVALSIGFTMIIIE